MSNIAERKNNAISASDHFRLKPFPWKPVDDIFKSFARHHNYRPSDRVEVGYMFDLAEKLWEFGDDNLETKNWKYHINALALWESSEIIFDLQIENASGVKLCIGKEWICAGYEETTARELYERLEGLFYNANMSIEGWNENISRPIFDRPPVEENFKMIMTEADKIFGPHSFYLGELMMHLSDSFPMEMQFGDCRLIHELFLGSGSSTLLYSYITTGIPIEFQVNSAYIKPTEPMVVDDLIGNRGPFSLEQYLKEILYKTSRWNNYITGR